MNRIATMGLVLCASSAAHAQWPTYTNQTAARLPTGVGFNEASLTTTCPEEKDYCWADFDRDGDTDVVVMRKRPLSCEGGRRNLLLMNENGVLIDRAATLANTALGVPGAQGVSQGFLDSTNDRQCVAIDLNNDGWLDLVTCTTLSDNLPRYIGYPRVYMNMGEVAGVWQGFRYEYARIPGFNGPPAAANPRLCSVAAGDVTGDGYADLYFADYDTPESAYCALINENAANDVNMRLLINQGAANPGFFSDESPTRMSGAQSLAAFGAHCLIADMNGDGNKDLVRINTLTSGQNISTFSNNASGTGTTFTTKQMYAGAPYGISVGDLNSDGRLDVIISDDSQDRYGYNTGNDINGLPNFNNIGFGVGESEFSGQNSLADLNNDGLLDAIIPDQDIDTNYVSSRQMRIYRNTGVGFVLATPFSSPFNKAVYNVATFDINGDGWRDFIIGRGANVSGSGSHATGFTDVFISNGLPGLTYAFPSGRPTSLTPDQDATFTVQLTGTFGGIPGASANIFVSVNGAAFAPTAMTPLGGSLFQANIPAQACGTSVRYYFSATSSGSTVTNPIGAPANFYTAPASDTSAQLLAENFESGAPGWSVSNDGSLTSGGWELGDPNGTWFEGYKASPEDDASAVGSNAYVTGLGSPGNAISAADVDGGSTHLVSPTFDLTDGNATISFKRWFYSNTQGDLLTVAVSNNNGGSWTTVATIKPPPTTNWNGPGEYQQSQWTDFSFNVGDYVTPTDQVKVRFSVADTTPAGFVEAGIDEFSVQALQCEAAPVCPSDVTGNGMVDIDDLLAVINSWGATGGPADVNGSGVVDIDDLLLVINGWGACK